jgi:hypothetical protein
MLCRNKVQDYEVWRRIFDSHKPLHLKAGLQLSKIWRSMEDDRNIFFLFEILDLEKARVFVSAPDNEQIGRDAGVIDGEILYLEELAGY